MKKKMEKIYLEKKYFTEIIYKGYKKKIIIYKIKIKKVKLLIKNIY